MTFEGFPLVVGWELTLACNLRCRHCASSAGSPRTGELSVKESLDICDQLPSLLVREVDFTGGEPLLHDGWPEIAARLAELGIPARMVTNGILLKESVPQLKAAGISTVAVSLDGLEATHDHIRQRPGLFRHLVSGIEAALAAGVPMAAITAVNDLNIEELPALMAFIRDLGIKHWQVQPTFARGRAREELSLSDETFMELGKFAKAGIARCKAEGISMMPADGVGYFTELDTWDNTWNGCGAGLASCGITADGKVKGCLSMPDTLVEGDLRERDLWSIWFDKHSFVYNRKFTVEDLGEACSGCEHGEQCRGGCSVMSISATNRFHNDPYCFHGIRARRGARQACG
jgi:radical SAM protein with 4Fe4S-binding SPASM domain